MPRHISLGDCQLDLSGHALLRDGQTITIEPTDYRVLLHLIESAPDYVSTELLLAHNWSSSYIGDNSLHQVIRRLRVALGDSARSPKFIQTLSKIGYRFIAEVENPNHNFSSNACRMNPILVTPFHHYSPNTEEIFFADGLAIELGQRLISAGAEVVTQNRINSQTTASLLHQELIKTYDARFALNGVITQKDKRLRTNTSLTDLENHRLLWSATYDCHEVSIFDMQSQLADQISAGVLGRAKEISLSAG